MLAMVAVTVFVCMGISAHQAFGDDMLENSDLQRFRVVTITEGLTNHWGLAFLPDGRMLVTERPGRLRYVDKNGKVSKPLKGVPEVFSRGQGGLLDVVLDPGYRSNGLVYLSCAEPVKGGGGTAVGRGRLLEDGIDSFEVIFRQVPETGAGVHFGSRLVFSRDG